MVMTATDDPVRRKLFLREWRRHRFLSMRDLAWGAGLALETVRRLESPSSDTSPQSRTLRKLAKALDVRPVDLYRLPGEGD